MALRLMICSYDYRGKASHKELEYSIFGTSLKKNYTNQRGTFLHMYTVHFNTYKLGHSFNLVLVFFF